MKKSEPPPVRGEQLTLCLVQLWRRVVVVAKVFAAQLHPRGVWGLGRLGLAGSLHRLMWRARLFAHWRRGHGLFRPSNGCGFFWSRFWKSNTGSQETTITVQTFNTQMSHAGQKVEAASKPIQALESVLSALKVMTSQVSVHMVLTFCHNNMLSNQLVWLISSSTTKLSC